MKRIEYLKTDLSLLPIPQEGYKTIGIDTDGVVKTIDDQGTIEGIGGSGGDGNGIFDAANSGGTVSTGFVVNLTDSLTLEASGTGNLLQIKNSLGNLIYRVGANGATNDGSMIIFDSTGTTIVNINGTYDSFNTGNDFGIGTPTPQQKLHVQAEANGDGIFLYQNVTPANIAGYIRSTAHNATGIAGGFSLKTDTGDAAVQMGGESATVSFIDDGNNFGIGEKSPNEKLHVGGNTQIDGTTTISSNTIIRNHGYSGISQGQIDLYNNYLTGFKTVQLGSTTLGGQLLLNTYDSGSNMVRLTATNGDSNILFNATKFGTVDGTRTDGSINAHSQTFSGVNFGRLDFHEWDGVNYKSIISLLGSKSSGGAFVINDKSEDIAVHLGGTLGANAQDSLNYIKYGLQVGGTIPLNTDGTYKLTVEGQTLLAGDAQINGNINASSLSTYADDTAAGVGGLTTGDLYITATGEVRIKL